MLSHPDPELVGCWVPAYELWLTRPMTLSLHELTRIALACC